MSFWNCFNQDYIFERLLRHKNQSAPLSVWQQRDVQCRVETNVFIHEITKEKIIFKLPPSYFEAEYLFQDRLPIFFHNELNEVIFKRENFTIAGIFLAVGFPYEVRFVEKRTIERLPYRYQDHQEVTFLHKNPADKKALIRVANMVNISVKGICLVTPIKDEKCFVQAQEVEILKMTQQNLADPVWGKITYVYLYNDLKEKGNKFAQIGVQFDRPLDSINHKTVASILEKKQKSMKGLEWDGFIGLTPEGQQSIISRAKTSNQTLPMAFRLNENLEYFEKTKYLTPRMKMVFLKEVPREALAKALRICLKEIIYELLYEVPARLREEILNLMTEPFPLNSIDIALVTVCDYLRDKEKKGEFVLDADLFNQEV